MINTTIVANKEKGKDLFFLESNMVMTAFEVDSSSWYDLLTKLQKQNINHHIKDFHDRWEVVELARMVNTIVISIERVATILFSLL